MENPNNITQKWQMLSYFLGQTRWKQADYATRDLMLTIAGANTRVDPLLTQSDLNNFSCSSLQKIDRLWMSASQGKFGFTTTLNIYEDVEEDFRQFCARVGWFTNDHWLKHNEIQFNLEAPPGHLPVTWLVPLTFGDYWCARFSRPGWRMLLGRFKECC
ncbi:GUN4 domain-containing protein [Roseofilum capinflatum]|uniref:GUN4 domain-containing protein n=1 Tax=Roseofilum capinflatum BLCC-M114 TaxID=3022440 RepID=A0ABT7B5C6_9CYAN|nr:GUN4 domain-containing protein [Roseofilum capinflatum]MDJ1174373.1 GUN4 domain-containing protein [Roseofilum capinflatum BLCC-M114]